MQLPDDPLDRFRSIYAALDAERGWFQGPNCLRFAAMSAVTCEGEAPAVAAGIRAMATEIKDAAGWCGELNSELRFIVAAILLLNGESATGFLEEVRRVRPFFRELGLRRGGIYETMAILILRLNAKGAPIERATVERFQELYEEMKRHHWWLTGPDDFPACAALTGQPGEPAEIGRDVEALYQGLSQAGFAKGDPLQTAANLLSLVPAPADTVVGRYRGLADACKASGIQVWQSDYDELAILSFLTQRPEEVFDRVVRYRAEMNRLKPRPDHQLTFNLAASLAFLELVRLDEDLQQVTDAKALMDMQALIQAQQAAAAAAATSAAVIAGAAATSSSSGS